MELTELRKIRKDQKITIGSLSKAIGINRDRISLIERGKVNPSFESVLAIAKGINAVITVSV